MARAAVWWVWICTGRQSSPDHSRSGHQRRPSQPPDHTHPKRRRTRQKRRHIHSQSSGQPWRGSRFHSSPDHSVLPPRGRDALDGTRCRAHLTLPGSARGRPPRRRRRATGRPAGHGAHVAPWFTVRPPPRAAVTFSSEQPAMAQLGGIARTQHHASPSQEQLISEHSNAHRRHRSSSEANTAPHTAATGAPQKLTQHRASPPQKQLRVHGRC